LRFLRVFGEFGFWGNLNLAGFKIFLGKII
jgi:hypothetical protein